MSKLIPKRTKNDGHWKNGQAYCYYLQNDTSGWTRVNLSFYSGFISKEQKLGQEKVMDFIGRRPGNKSWVWFNPIGWTLNYDEGDDVLRDELERVLSDEIPRFEQELSDFLKNN